MLNKDFKDILQLLLEENVEFLLVGGYAMGAHGYPRATKDIDIWVWADTANSAKVFHTLAKFGAPMGNVSPLDFSEAGVVFQIGVPPNRVDIITDLSGVDFKTCWGNRIVVSIDGLDIPVIGRGDLIANKRALGRPQDQVDADILDNGS
jgi:hypothetical protein